MLRNHRLIVQILENFRQYREGRLDAAGLAQNVYAIGAALEGDVHREVRDAIHRAEGELELIAFTKSGDEERAAVDEIRQEIEKLVQQWDHWSP